MHRRSSAGCIWFLVFLLCASMAKTVFAAEDLLKIPKYFPTEPGLKNTYRCKGDGDLYNAEINVREVTHNSSVYSMSATVSLRQQKEIEFADVLEFQVDCVYKANQLTVTITDASFVISNVLPVNEPGDAMQGRGSHGDGSVISFDGKVVSTTTKVAIDGSRWDDAMVVAVEMPTRGQRLKLTLAAPEGLIRASVVTTRGEGSMELLPPRRP